MAACSCAESTERLSDAHPASNAPCAEGAHAGGQVIGLLVQQSVLELSGLADYFGLSD